VRASTIERREWQIRSFASALVWRGKDPATITCLATLVEFENFKEGLRFFIERSGRKRPLFASSPVSSPQSPGITWNSTRFSLTECG
jgi:hypothetical protein